MSYRVLGKAGRVLRNKRNSFEEVEGSPMSPPNKKHRNCSCPFREEGSFVFKPAGTPLKVLERMRLYRDELEALHLCDGLGLTQQDAGVRMGVSRGTVQRLVTSGRKKTVNALTEGQALIVGRDDLSESEV
jgi:predicted DNA-binding protein (UPF0251 family)